jgi:D-glycero-D-manno-heptose 1,7-bisphosphate phosphatase
MRPAVFVDRDGVLNKTIYLKGVPTPPRSIKEVEILSGVKEAILLFKSYGLEVIVVTNQPDVARGRTSRADVEQINAFLSMELEIQHFYVCYHDDDDSCHCRKPNPGLLEAAAQELDIDLARSFLVGDRWKDIDAGNAVSCKSYLVDYGFEEQQPRGNFTRVKSLLDAATQITYLK